MAKKFKFNKGDSVKVTLSGEVRGTITDGSLTVVKLETGDTVYVNDPCLIEKVPEPLKPGHLYLDGNGEICLCISQFNEPEDLRMLYFGIGTHLPAEREFYTRDLGHKDDFVEGLLNED